MIESRRGVFLRKEAEVAFGESTWTLVTQVPGREMTKFNANLGDWLSRQSAAAKNGGQRQKSNTTAGQVHVVEYVCSRPDTIDVTGVEDVYERETYRSGTLDLAGSESTWELTTSSLRIFLQQAFEDDRRRNGQQRNAGECCVRALLHNGVTLHRYK